MKNKAIIKTTLLIFLIIYSLNALAQKAVLYNYDFKIPDGYRHTIQNYDERGAKKYIVDPYGKTVPDTYLEPITLEEVHAICESAAEILKLKYGYTELSFMYPNPNIVSSTGGKVSNFPNKGFKTALKKNPADAFITMEFNIDNKAFSTPQSSLEFEENGTERTIYINVIFSYVIYNAQEGIIAQKEISLNDELDPLFNENYNTEIVDGGFKLRKLYLSKEEIMTIYKMAEEKLAAAE